MRPYTPILGPIGGCGTPVDVEDLTQTAFRPSVLTASHIAGSRGSRGSPRSAPRPEHYDMDQVVALARKYGWDIIGPAL